MAKTKDQKQQIIKSLSEVLKKSGIVFFNYTGLTVKDFEELRSQALKQGSSIMVSKKTLLQKVLKESKVNGASEQHFDGEVAIISSEKDETGPARILAQFQKKHEQIKILNGIFERGFIDSSKVCVLSSLPGRKELYGQIAGSLNAPISNFASLGQRLLFQFIRTVEAIHH